MRFHKRHAPLLQAFFMALAMAAIMSGVLTAINTGVDAGFPARWWHAFSLAVWVAFPVAYLVGGRVRQLVTWLTRD